MLAGGYSWRLFFYVESAFAAGLLTLAFFFVEESTYHRAKPTASPPQTVTDLTEKTQGPLQVEESATGVVPERKSYLSTLKPWSSIDHEAEFFTPMWRCFTYFLVPSAFWVITSFGESHL